VEEFNEVSRRMVALGHHRMDQTPAAWPQHPHDPPCRAGTLANQQPPRVRGRARGGAL